MLGWPCEGTEPAGRPPCSDLGPTPCQEQTCVRARSSSELLSGDLSSKQARSNKARGTEAFLTLSVQALWEQNKRGFGNKQHKYVFTHAHNRLCAHSVGCEHTVAVLPLGPASKGKMEAVTHSATKKLPVLALLSPLLTSMQPDGLGAGHLKGQAAAPAGALLAVWCRYPFLSLFIMDGLWRAILGKHSGIEQPREG